GEACIDRAFHCGHNSRSPGGRQNSVAGREQIPQRPDAWPLPALGAALHVHRVRPGRRSATEHVPQRQAGMARLPLAVGLIPTLDGHHATEIPYLAPKYETTELFS